jgi:hypothetical protein
MNFAPKSHIATSAVRSSGQRGESTTFGEDRTSAEAELDQVGKQTRTSALQGEMVC